jgi:hypothetical protein
MCASQRIGRLPVTAAMGGTATLRSGPAASAASTSEIAILSAPTVDSLTMGGLLNGRLGSAIALNDGTIETYWMAD